MDLGKNYTHRVALKSDRRLWDTTHAVWRDRQLRNRGLFGASPIATRLVNLCREARDLNPNTREEFWGYLNPRITPGDVEALREQAHLLTHHTRPVVLHPHTALLVVAHHIIDETVDGFLAEVQLLTFLREHFPQAEWRFATPEEDRNWGVDIIGTHHTGTRGVQVKPLSYMNGYRSNPKIWENRHAEHHHHERFLDAHPGGSVSNWVFTSEGWVFTPAGEMGCVLCDREAAA